MPQAAAATAVAPAPPAGFASTIARSGLGAASTDGGSSTITFGTPAQDGVPEYVPFSTAPVTVSRAEQEASAPEPAPEESSATTATAAPPAPPAAPPAAAAGDPETLFEDLYDRLKRELLLEQEQLGQAFRET
jgi:hypothetical protein